MNSFGETRLRKIESRFLILAAGFIVICLMTISDTKLDGFTIWVLCPYIVYFGFSKFIITPSLFSAQAGAFVAFLMFAFTVGWYIYGFFISPSSTSGLLLIFVPVYLLVGGIVLLGLILAIGRLTKSQGHRDT